MAAPPPYTESNSINAAGGYPASYGAAPSMAYGAPAGHAQVVASPITPNTPKKEHGLTINMFLLLPVGLSFMLAWLLILIGSIVTPVLTDAGNDSVVPFATSIWPLTFVLLYSFPVTWLFVALIRNGDVTHYAGRFSGWWGESVAPLLFRRNIASAYFHLVLALGTPLWLILSLLLYLVYVMVYYLALLPVFSIATCGFGATVLLITWPIDVFLLIGPIVLLPVHLVWVFFGTLLSICGCGEKKPVYYHYSYEPVQYGPIASPVQYAPAPYIYSAAPTPGAFV